MVSSKLSFVATAVAALAPLASAFDASSRSNLAIYWGQGPNQLRLSHFCQETSLDIINIGFINYFPDMSPGHWPGSNFGNQCDGSVYVTNDGVVTKLLSGCHQIMEDIPICQAAGKKVLLSIGGAYPPDQSILSEDSAVAFATFLWGAFGPVAEGWEGPRPFGDVVVDGFDFDIEHNGGFGYATMVNTFRQYFNQVPERKFYLSAAPQCIIPDAQLSDAIFNAAFDFIWIQYYNTAACSAKSFIDTSLGTFNFDAWVTVLKASASKDAKLYVGLPASETAANQGYYLTPDEVESLVSTYMDRYPDTFGGIMLWEATASENNQIDGSPYADHMKDILLHCDPSPPVTSSSAIPSSTPVTTPSPSSSAVPSSTPAVSETPSPSSSAVPSSTPVASSTPVVPGTSASSSPVSSSSAIAPSTPVVPGTSTSSSTPVASSTPVVPGTSASSSPVSSSSAVAPSTPVVPGTSVPSSTPAIPGGSSSSSEAVASSTPLVTLTLTVSPTPAPSSSESSSTDLSSSTQTDVGTAPSQPAGPSTTATATTSSSSSSTDESSTTVGSGNGNGSGSTTTTAATDSITAAPTATSSATATGATSEPVTITTVIVTSYIDICPTGFTTVTTTYTTTYCPGTNTATATATVTNPPSGPGGAGSQTTAPTVPEGWTTTVTVCTQCAAKPTTVTLTLPVTETGSTSTDAVPAPPAATGEGSNPTQPSGASPTGGNGSFSEEPVPPPAVTQVSTSTEIVTLVRPTSSRPLILGTGTVHPSSTLAVKPSAKPSGQNSGSSSHVPIPPSYTQEAVSPLSTGAASRVTGLGHGLVLTVLTLSAFFVL
ncbi:Endochitinase A1 [Aspergillus fumigatus]|nr:Endochitinase A1 [Aspergillus fumigatus]KAH1507347.1 Endochitinase A1 [Aspergillus fumigatus]KAH1520170.1 Endochitinase A1 [Aspergillus fumigatus]KAH1588331.1 Endochitinase A1 [Aspergillus fumigatus]KAH1743531.1 Endochitinase A1 [Aspergillus fumigatus]